MKTIKSKWYYFAIAAIIITLISAVRLSYIETIMDVDDTSDVVFYFIIDNREGKWIWIHNSDMNPEDSGSEINTESIVKCLSPCRIKKTLTPGNSLMLGDVRYQIFIMDKTRRNGSYFINFGDVNRVQKYGEKYLYEIINHDEIVEKIDELMEGHVNV